jgi:hypothetical protein
MVMVLGFRLLVIDGWLLLVEVIDGGDEGVDGGTVVYY